MVPICSYLSGDQLRPTVDESLLRAQKLQVSQARPGVSKGLAEEISESEEHVKKLCCFLFFWSLGPNLPLLSLQLMTYPFLILKDKLATLHEKRDKISPLPTRNH